MASPLVFMICLFHRNALLLMTALQMYTTSHTYLPRFDRPSSPDNEASHLRPLCSHQIKHLAHPVKLPPSLQALVVHSHQHHARLARSPTLLPRPQGHRTRLLLQTSSTPSPLTCPFQIPMIPCPQLAPVATPVLSFLMPQLRPH